MGITLATKITIIRIIAIPLLVIAILNNATVIAFVIFAISLCTDALDGLVARRRKEHSQLGKFLDPMADKLLLSAAYWVLAYKSWIPLWVFIAVFSRDLFLFLGWTLLYILTGSAQVEPRLLGKLTTVMQMMAALWVLLEALLGWHINGAISQVLLWAMLGVTALSLVDYIVSGSKRFNNFTG